MILIIKLFDYRYSHYWKQSNSWLPEDLCERNSNLLSGSKLLLEDWFFDKWSIQILDKGTKEKIVRQFSKLLMSSFLRAGIMMDGSENVTMITTSFIRFNLFKNNILIYVVFCEDLLKTLNQKSKLYRIMRYIFLFSWIKGVILMK